MSILDPTVTPETPAAVAAETAARIAADQYEAQQRAAADVSQTAARAAGDAKLSARIDHVESVAAVVGGAQTTRLTHLAGARAIADVGSDGTTITIVTVGAHGMADGDYVNITGTVRHDGDYGPIDVTAADELRAPTTLAATLHETTGTVRTAALRVESDAEFLLGIWLEVVNDAGQLHVATRIGPIEPNIIHLSAAVPTNWFDERTASPTSMVAISTREVVLSRSAAIGTENAGMTLPQVVDMLANVVHVDGCGADPFGVNDSAPAFQQAVNLAGAMGGGRVVAGGPGSRYLLATDVVIRSSNVTLDGLGALIVGTSAGRFYVNGDSGINGDWSAAVHNTHVVNWRIGESITDDAQIARAPRLSWAIDCSIKNVIKESRSGTAFTLDVCQRCEIVDSVARGVRSSGGGSFGFLVHMCDDCTLDRCTVADAPFYYAYQIKGGNRNTVRDCLAKNIVASGTRRTIIAFRDRGSAPYHAAPLATQALTYPYVDVGWTTADSRRESRKTRYINCHVSDCTMVAFLAQEARDTEFIDCSADNLTPGKAITGGLTLRRTDGDVIARLTADALAGATTLTIEMEIDGETGQPAAPFLAGQSVIVELDAQIAGGALTHSTTAASDQVGSTLVIAAPLPGNASAGRGVGHAQVGQERGYRVRGFRESGASVGHGVAVIGAASSYLPGVSIADCEVNLNKQHGIFALYTDQVQIERCRANNNNQTATTNSRGITVSNSTRPWLLDCIAVDDQATHTQVNGIHVAEANCTDPVVRGCYASGNTSLDFLLRLAGIYGQNSPGEGFATTTDATGNNTIWRLQLQDGQVVEVELVVLARRTNGDDHARYTMRGIYKQVAGTLSAIVAPVSVLTDYESQAAYNAALAISSNVLRLTVTGIAGHTINWSVQARTNKAA